jgi:uncharacterized protein (DUF1786 family)
MKILLVDVGTGTQDIFLYDSNLHIENGFKLVVPSPTMMVHQRIKSATRARQAILLEGVMMGGGPSAWAAEAHARAGLPTYATPDAARTLDDDLEGVQELGVRLVSEDEAAALPDSVSRVAFRDFDMRAIRDAFAPFAVDLADLAAVAVAVFDHGDAPPGVSDRQFRFDYLDERIRAENSLAAFAYPAGEIPPIMTRLRAVAASAGDLDVPLVVMDTAPAAVLGATFDPLVAALGEVIVTNIGNFHTLAFRLGSGGIQGVFEHHTGEIDLPRLASLLGQLADSTLRHEDVFEDMGHGALMYTDQPFEFGEDAIDVVVTGPRRSMFDRKSQISNQKSLNPYFAAPFGDMMIAGCFGLLAATAEVLPGMADPIHASLHDTRGGRPPWEVSI